MLRLSLLKDVVKNSPLEEEKEELRQKTSKEYDRLFYECEKSMEKIINSLCY